MLDEDRKKSQSFNHFELSKNTIYTLMKVIQGFDMNLHGTIISKKNRKHVC